MEGNSPWWSRLMACERKIERLIRTIDQLKIQIRALQQQLADRRSQ